MKLKVSVLAISAALAGLSSGAFAQQAAPASTVTIFGIIDAAVTHASPGSGGTGSGNFRVDSGVQSGSRFGLRGSEDLGGGLRANFLIENGFSVDTGAQADAARLFNRQAYVGLSQGAFEVRLGRQYSPFYMSLQNDPIGLGFWAPAAVVTGYAYSRLDNAVELKYAASGLTLRLVASTGAENLVGTTKSAGRFTGIGGDYRVGGLIISGAYQEAKTNAPVPLFTDKEWVINAVYNFGGFGVQGGYSQVDPGAAATATSNRKITSFWVGGTVSVAGGQILAHYGERNPDNAAKSRIISLNYTYPLSRRTNLYVSAAQIQNNGTAPSVTLAAAGATSIAPAVVGADPRAISFGVRHNF